MERTKKIKEYVIITLGTLIVSMAVYFFLLPSNVVVGSLSGLVMVLATFIPLKISVMTFILNAVLLVVGFLFIGKEFGAKTVYTSLLMPVFLYVFELIFPNNKSLTNDVVLDTICYILVVSVGLALLFNANASSGGLDIVAKLLNKYLHIEIGKAMTLAGMCTAISSIFGMIRRHWCSVFWELMQMELFWIILLMDLTEENESVFLRNSTKNYKILLSTNYTVV